MRVPFCRSWAKSAKRLAARRTHAWECQREYVVALRSHLQVAPHGCAAYGGHPESVLPCCHITLPTLTLTMVLTRTLTLNLAICMQPPGC